MNGDRKNELRRKSMLGTALFALGIVGAVAFVITGTIWVGAAAVVLLVPAVAMLSQVGKSLR
jgi:uncharacterized membrane protein